jgi:hypothetical protein
MCVQVVVWCCQSLRLATFSCSNKSCHVFGGETMFMTDTFLWPLQGGVPGLRLRYGILLHERCQYRPRPHFNPRKRRSIPFYRGGLVKKGLFLWAVHYHQRRVSLVICAHTFIHERTRSTCHQYIFDLMDCEAWLIMTLSFSDLMLRSS